LLNRRDKTQWGHSGATEHYARHLQKGYSGPADGAIYNTGDDELSIAQKMESQGVKWVPSNKKPGSRVNGAALFADMLEAVIEGKKLESGMPEKPAFTFSITAVAG
jgi:hypothetical protein